MEGFSFYKGNFLPASVPGGASLRCRLLGGPGHIFRGSSRGVLSSLTRPPLGTVHVNRKTLRRDTGKVVSAGHGTARLCPQSFLLGPKPGLLVDSQLEAGVFCCFVLGRVWRATSSRKVEAGRAGGAALLCPSASTVPCATTALPRFVERTPIALSQREPSCHSGEAGVKLSTASAGPAVWEQPAPSSLSGDQGHTRHWPKMQSWKGRWDLSPEQLVVRGLSPCFAALVSFMCEALYQAAGTNYDYYHTQ